MKPANQYLQRASKGSIPSRTKPREDMLGVLPSSLTISEAKVRTTPRRGRIEGVERERLGSEWEDPHGDAATGSLVCVDFCSETLFAREAVKKSCFCPLAPTIARLERR